MLWLFVCDSPKIKSKKIVCLVYDEHRENKQLRHVITIDDDCDAK